MWTRHELKTRAKEIMKTNYWNIVLVALLASIAGGSKAFNAGGAARNEDIQSNISSFGNMDPAILAAAMVGIAIVLMVATVVVIALKIFVLNPLEVSCCRFFIQNHARPANLSELSFGFKHNYMNIVKTMFLRDLFTFLWSLLFVIPGIIKSYEYRMIPYLLAEAPDMAAEETFARTKVMMTGDKANAFVLDLSFIGWEILGAMTCGILTLFYVNPYVQLTNCELYGALTAKMTD